VETKAEKTRMAKIKRRGEGRGRKEMRKESRAKEKKQKKEKTIDVKKVVEKWEI